MTTTRNVIASKYLPCRPFVAVRDSLLLFLVLGRFNAPGWRYGAFGLRMAVALVGGVVLTCTEVECHPAALKPEAKQ